ncbi:MAG TPA: deoxyribose-phosphate aldolase [Malonomonas sp.]
MTNPAAFLDQTLLKPDVTKAQIEALCEEAVEYGFAAVCLPPAFVGRAADLLYGSEVKLCSVVGFPCGYSSLRQKVVETADLVAQGVVEIDMVVQIGQLLENRFDAVEEEIAQVVLAAGDAAVKVIIECCYLSPQLMQSATETVVRSGAAFVKTSTGFGPSGARLDDVRLLAKVAAGRIGVKAAGGIRDLETCQAMLAAGATRVGTSAGVQIVEQWQACWGR